MATETKEAVSKALDELLDRVTRYDARIDGVTYVKQDEL